MLFKAGRKKHKSKEVQKKIGFDNNNDNGLFKKSSDFPGFGFRVDEKKAAEFKFDGRVLMPIQLYQKMFLFATNITKEISGLGMVERVGNELHIIDLFILKQIVTSGNTTLDNSDLAQKTLDIINAGGDPSKMKLWWHSHGTGGTFWSITDDRCCDAYNNDQWLLSMVINCKKEIRCRLDIYTPVRITLDNIPVVVEEPASYLSELEEQCKEEMKEKVRESASSFHYGANVTEEKKEETTALWECPGCRFVSCNSQLTVAHMISKHSYGRSEAWEALVRPKDKEEQPKETDNDSPLINFEDLYDENQTLESSKLAFHDTFNVYWFYDTQAMLYYPMWANKKISKQEYAFIADSLAQGLRVDKELNVIT